LEFAAKNIVPTFENMRYLTLKNPGEKGDVNVARSTGYKEVLRKH
jgi:hypothetical protein